MVGDVHLDLYLHLQSIKVYYLISTVCRIWRMWQISHSSCPKEYVYSTVNYEFYGEVNTELYIWHSQYCLVYRKWLSLHDSGANLLVRFPGDLQ